MIKSESVRRGNLVEYEGRIFEIDSISEDFPTLNTSEFGIGVVDWNNVNPIPLTEEWLVKFGFEKANTKKKQYFRFVNRGMRLRVLRGIKRVGYNFFATSGGFYFDCQYIHQLQNLYFALTGEELKIKES